MSSFQDSPRSTPSSPSRPTSHGFNASNSSVFTGSVLDGINTSAIHTNLDYNNDSDQDSLWEEGSHKESESRSDDFYQTNSEKTESEDDEATQSSRLQQNGNVLGHIAEQDIHSRQSLLANALGIVPEKKHRHKFHSRSLSTQSTFDSANPFVSTKETKSNSNGSTPAHYRNRSNVDSFGLTYVPRELTSGANARTSKQGVKSVSFSPIKRASFKDGESDSINAGLEDLHDLLNSIAETSIEDYVKNTPSMNDVNFIVRDRQLKKLQEEEEFEKMAGKLNQLKVSRDGRVQGYLDELERQRQAEEWARLEEERKRLEEELRVKRETEERLRRKYEEEQRKIREAEEEKRRIEEERQKRIREEAERQQKEEEERQRKLLEAKKFAEEERARQTAAEKAAANARAKAEAEKALKKKKEEEEKAKNARGPAVSQEVAEEFLRYKKKILDIKEQIYTPVNSNPELKRFMMQVKRKIRPKLGQLTDSKNQIITIFKDLAGTIESCKVNDTAYQWALNFYSKALIDQAEAESSVRVDRALPLGILTTFLLGQFPELHELLMARFVKKCPLLIGYSCSIDTEEGRLRMGYGRKDEGTWEAEERYCERLGGIAAVWAVVTISQPLGAGKPHPYPIENSWRMLARLVNTHQALLQNVHFTVAATWWEIASETMVKAYGKQAVKLLQLLAGQWAQLGAERKYPAALRLQLQGEDWQKTGKLRSLKRLEP